ncbi:MAG: radical SAM protein [Synergistaceae bacterium]|jgi:MoaA/NifB/PqqE/SkfB family radical SAM enzyme|nr:radical SAM protein [Synergistaceae bacterium]
MTRFTLINPALLALRNDLMTTGIAYMPIGLAIIAAQLKAQGHKVSVIDAFGEAIYQTRKIGPFLCMGLSTKQIVDLVPRDTDVIGVYALTLLNHNATITTVKALRAYFPFVPIAVIENSQAVTAYSLSEVAALFYEAGATYIVTEDSDNSQNGFDLDITWSDGDPPFPSWDLFPLHNYWSLRHAHGPFTSRRYLPIITSRGCPFNCKFCVIPFTNKRRWVARSPETVVEEMAWGGKKFGVFEFHWEDLNPTVDDARIRDICQIIASRDMKLSWKLVAGTKVEGIKDEESIDLMAAAGCNYISISPESASKHVLNLMGKPFNFDHAHKIIKGIIKKKIFLQCCFVLGFPGETDEDRDMTSSFIMELASMGVDEIALFIMTPVPGAAEYERFQKNNRSLSELNFSPTWRNDYAKLSILRKSLYRRFVFQKTMHYPFKVMRQSFNFFRRHFETKMEMVPYKALRYRFQDFMSVNGEY